MEFSNLEKRDILECYIRNNKNAVRAANEYFDRYFDRRQPSLPTFKRLYDNLGNYGSFTQPKNYPNIRINEAAEVNVLANINQNPRISTREVAEEAGTSQRTVVRVLKKHKFHPYRLSVSQTLHPEDPEKRVNFCAWFRVMCQNNQNFPHKVLWTDETRFTNCGMFNRHNEHLWMQENPFQVEQRRPQIKFGFNVWCGILGSKLIGPFIFEGTLTGDRYLQFLQHHLENMLDDLNLETRRNLQWFQHDGAPPHNFLPVRNYLDEIFPNSWIGRNAPVLWPPRSPDLSVLDFYLWGAIKDKVYKETYASIDELRVAVIEAFNNVDGRSLRKATNSVLKRCNICFNNNGGIFENTL
jgi:hypothetical protein